MISIHAPREGGDFIDEVSLIWDNHFNPRPPRGGRLLCVILSILITRFQSTPPARGATLVCAVDCRNFRISIHAPREGGDSPGSTGVPSHGYFNPRPPRGGRLCLCGTAIELSCISIHAPREGGDTAVPVSCRPLFSIFQSTPPARGATGLLLFLFGWGLFQSTPPARGATWDSWAKSCCLRISIHAPREGGDCNRWSFALRRTISIHAPREGGDHRLSCGKMKKKDFNPRPPRGGRLQQVRQAFPHHRYFNPRPPRGGRHSWFCCRSW